MRVSKTPADFTSFYQEEKTPFLRLFSATPQFYKQKLWVEKYQEMWKYKGSAACGCSPWLILQRRAEVPSISPSYPRFVFPALHPLPKSPPATSHDTGSPR